MKPLIALNLDIVDEDPQRVRVRRTYLRAIQQWGGIPILVPPADEKSLSRICKMVNGFLFIGGRDYASSLYGEASHPTTDPINADRQALDLALMRRALRSRDDKGRDKPILAICAGHQLLNIVQGGSLIQDIESCFPGTGSIHRLEGSRASHAVKFEDGSLMKRIYRGSSLDGVASYHHQAVNKLGRHLIATGYSDDGVIESIEHSKREFTIGVQWHPEVDRELNSRLFRSFIRQSRKMAVGSS